MDGSSSHPHDDNPAAPLADPRDLRVPMGATLLVGSYGWDPARAIAAQRRVVGLRDSLSDEPSQER